jgi:hypothetical protein
MNTALFQHLADMHRSWKEIAVRVNNARNNIYCSDTASRSLHFPSTKVISNLHFHASGTEQETAAGLRCAEINL